MLQGRQGQDSHDAGEVVRDMGQNNPVGISIRLRPEIIYATSCLPATTEQDVARPNEVADIKMDCAQFFYNVLNIL